MAKPIDTTSPSFVNLTILDELMNLSQSLNTTTRILCDHAKPPLDAACLLFVCQGAERAFAAAMKTLHEPNALAVSVHEQLMELATACQQVYSARDKVDAYSALKRRLQANPAWAALAKLGSLSQGTCTGIAAAMGVNLGLAWAGKKLLAGGYMRTLRRCLPDEIIPVQELLANLPSRVEFSDEDWPKQLAKFLPDFWVCFDTHDHPPARQKTISEKAVSEWKGRSAFPTYRRRAAVLDKTCLSPQQIANACQWTPLSGFQTAEDYQIAVWLIGFSGLYVESVHRIPIVDAAGDLNEEDWAIGYQLGTGLLVRDLSALATDAAKAEGRISEPASYVIALPAPQHLAHYIQGKCTGSTPIKDFGDLIPRLRQLTPEGMMYPTLEELKPSWARWNRTVGPYMRQLGMDNFLTAIMVGDLGLTAKSKAYYARVQAKETWTVAQVIYARLGLGEPVAVPSNLMAFGSQVTPSSKAIQELDDANLERLNALWPGKHCKLERHYAFHNAYVIALGLRFMVRLSLRAASGIPVSASLDEDRDATIDVVEKGSADRKGGIATLLTDSACQEIRLLRAHCKAFLKRLRNLGQHNAITQWLEAVVNHEDVPLLQRIGANGTTTVLSTGDVLDEVCKDYRLAEDFGRKWNENSMRIAGCRTGDIDRMLRHEVAGQEATTSLSDCSEETWSRRTRAAIEPLHDALFPRPLRGLRKE